MYEIWDSDSNVAEELDIQGCSAVILRWMGCNILKNGSAFMCQGLADEDGTRLWYLWNHSPNDRHIVTSEGS